MKSTKEKISRILRSIWKKTHVKLSPCVSFIDVAKWHLKCTRQKRTMNISVSKVPLFCTYMMNVRTYYISIAERNKNRQYSNHITSCFIFRKALWNLCFWIRYMLFIVCLAVRLYHFIASQTIFIRHKTRQHIMSTKIGIR